MVEIKYKTLTREDIVKGFREDDNNVINYLGKLLLNDIKAHVKKNSGNEQEATELLTDVLIKFREKCKKDPDFKLEKGFKNLFFIMYSRMWIDVLRKRKALEVNIDIANIAENKIPDLESIEREDLQKTLCSIIDNTLLQIKHPEKCKEIIDYDIIQEKNQKEIGNILGKSPNLISKTKKRCLKKLKELLLQNKQLILMSKEYDYVNRLLYNFKKMNHEQINKTFR